MKVVLHQITKSEDGLIDLAVSIGNDPPKNYRANYDVSDDNYKIGSIDEELFIALSELAHKRFGNCFVYQLELTGIVDAFKNGDELPKLPAEFGTTKFCSLPPGSLRIFWNKLKILVYKVGFLSSHTWVHPDYRNAA